MPTFFCEKNGVAGGRRTFLWLWASHLLEVDMFGITAQNGERDGTNPNIALKTFETVDIVVGSAGEFA